MSITTANKMLMQSILSLAPAASSAMGGARGQFRQISVGMGAASTSVADTVPVNFEQIKNQMGAYNTLKANGVQAAAVSHSNLATLIPMKDKEEMKDMLRAFNKARAGAK
ncbi:hypothetical protein T484DRAFT_1846439 [Baffinella frigidus]|nr:hypothetical protein T484DRAFT_1846439 [Cryptophyta sp. CCMP2293]